MDSTELTVTDETMDGILSTLPPVQAPEIVEEAQSIFLPYLTVVQTGSKIASPPFQEPAGSFILHHSKTDHVNLGKELDIFICDMRHKAMHFSEKGVVSQYDPQSQEFKDIVAQADAKADGFAWGYEFLIYLGDSGKYATFFCNTVSMRMSAGRHLAPRVRQMVTLMTDFITHKSYSWWSFKTQPCEVPLAVPATQSSLVQEIERFQQQSVEVVHEEGETTTELLEDR